MTATICILGTIVVYLIGMVAVGAYFSKNSGSNTDDFYLGGRKLGPIVAAMSAEASDMSSYLLMGLPGLAYFCGLSDVGWTVIGLGVGQAPAPLLGHRRQLDHQSGVFFPPVS